MKRKGDSSFIEKRVNNITYPLPKERMRDEDTFLNCRWCGVELNDKRKRFCCQEHRDEWLDVIYWPEDFQRQRKKALERDKKTCQDCGMTNLEHIKKFNQSLHAHHIVPRIDGGSNYVDNLVILCQECHIKRHKAMGEEVKWKDKKAVNAHASN